MADGLYAIERLDGISFCQYGITYPIEWPLFKVLKTFGQYVKRHEIEGVLEAVVTATSDVDGRELTTYFTITS